MSLLQQLLLQYQMLRHNLARSLDSNRAPLILTLNADYLQLNEEHSGMQALERFAFFGKAVALRSKYRLVRYEFHIMLLLHKKVVRVVSSFA